MSYIIGNYNITTIVKKYLLPSLLTVKNNKQINLNHIILCTIMLRGPLDFKDCSINHNLTYDLCLSKERAWKILTNYP
jgi:hypothetical protein